MSQQSSTGEDTTNKPEVLLACPLFPDLAAPLAGRFRFLALDAPAAASVRVLLAPGIAKVPADVIDRLVSLELVVATSTGVDHIDLETCRRRGISVTNVGAAFSPDVADFAVALLVDLYRRICAADRFVRRKEWPAAGQFPLGSKVGGKRVGIVGLGNIGTLVAERLEAFGCTIFYNSRSSKPSVPYKYFSNVRDLAAESDALVLSCTLNAETHHIINRQVLTALGKDGILINVGRGGLVDEKELVKCLQEGVIAGAGLDVYENEPEVPKELMQMENVVLSNHQAVATPETGQAMVQVVIANLEAFFSGKPLVSPVTL